jgi:hypothetical protein
VNRARRAQGAPAAREVIYEGALLPDPASLRRPCSRRSSPSLCSLACLTHLTKGFTVCAKNSTSAPSSSPTTLPPPLGSWRVARRPYYVAEPRFVSSTTDSLSDPYKDHVVSRDLSECLSPA